MRKTTLLLLLLLQCLCPDAQTTTAVRELTLSNGLTVWLNEDHSQPTVYGAVVVKAGAKDCPNTGIAHYFEHLLFKGTDKIGTTDYAAEKVWLDSISAQYDLLAATTDSRRRADIQRHINDLSVKAAAYAIPNEFENLITTYGGTGLNAYTSFDETVYHNAFVPQYLAQWCEINSERLRSPVFRLFQGELETVYEEKNMYADQMVVQAAEAVQRHALAGTPYAYPIIGSTESLKNPRLSEMMDFYNTYYVAGNMGLVLCGDVQTDSIVPLLERTFGRIRRGQAPHAPAATLRSLRGTKGIKVKLPIPIVKAVGYAFKAPTEHSADYLPFMVATKLLYNDSGTGLLDSLSGENKVMALAAGGYDFKDFSIYGFGAVPNLPFGTKKKAARLCWQQVERLRQGNIDPALLEAAKLETRRAMDTAMEHADSRSRLMVNAFSHGLAWASVVGRSRAIDQITPADVARVARTYFNDDSLKITKTFGRYPKERVAQPGYKALAPANAGKQSAYAKALAGMPRAAVEPKVVNPGRDATHRQLAPLANLYTVANNINPIFNLQLVYRHGSRNDRRIAALPGYLNTVGTNRQSHRQLRRALQQLGATLSVSATAGELTVTLTGYDSHLEQAMALLSEFLTGPERNEKKYREMVKRVRLEEKSFAKDNNNLATAALAMAAMGEQSAYLRRMSARELRRMDGADMAQLFGQVQQHQLDVVYSGTAAAAEVARLVSRHVPLDRVQTPWHYAERMLQPSSEPMVYLLHTPHARQTIVCTYRQTAPMTSWRDRALLNLWGNYFGSGMSSVMFQDIREFRSLAYTAHGNALRPDFRHAANAPCGYTTRMGTQADKAMQAIEILDSLLRHMPLREANMAAARHELVNQTNNSYPTFRTLGRAVADLRLLGYGAAPEQQVLQQLPSLQLDDVNRFYQTHLQHRPYVTIVVGNKRSLDPSRLNKWGKVVELRTQDVYRQ